MRPSFHPRLINDPFSDPGLFIPFLFDKRALLFDLGDLGRLSPRDLLKVSHVFVSHFHMDHFIGFDSLLRLFLGRDQILHIFGPESLFRHLEGKLAGYTWNLVEEYQNDFRLIGTEVTPSGTHTREYICRNQFRSRDIVTGKAFSGILLEEPSFRVEAAILDHRIPCLGLSLVENFYININKDSLKRLGLPVGPWLNRFKDALYNKEALDREFPVTWEEEGKVIREKKFPLGELAEEIAVTSPGQKITYITDVVGSPENRDRIIDLARGADHLFIEAAFMESEREAAEKKYHLTAREAGELARGAGVKNLSLFHFSPRYMHRADEIENEAMDAFQKA